MILIDMPYHQDDGLEWKGRGLHHRLGSVRNQRGAVVGTAQLSVSPVASNI